MSAWRRQKQEARKMTNFTTMFSNDKDYWETLQRKSEVEQ